jgi:alcohol dehydrogenase
LKILGSNGWAKQDVVALLDLVQQGKLKALVDETFPLEAAADALQRIEDRKVFGKLVITP